jgi:preprotein translocase subunit SecE
MDNMKSPRGFLKKAKNMLNKIITFVKEARIELGKVNWPSKRQTVNYTLIVIGVSLVVAAFLGGLDYIFSTLMKAFIIK